jgi:hypothetical protein
MLDPNLEIKNSRYFIPTRRRRPIPPLRTMMVTVRMLSLQSASAMLPGSSSTMVRFCSPLASRPVPLSPTNQHDTEPGSCVARPDLRDDPSWPSHHWPNRIRGRLHQPICQSSTIKLTSLWVSKCPAHSASRPLTRHSVSRVRCFERDAT